MSEPISGIPMTSPIKYQYGAYRRVGDSAEVWCTHESPMVPKGIVPDYSRMNVAGLTYQYAVQRGNGYWYMSFPVKGWSAKVVK